MSPLLNHFKNSFLFLEKTKIILNCCIHKSKTNLYYGIAIDYNKAYDSIRRKINRNNESIK